MDKFRAFRIDEKDGELTFVYESSPPKSSKPKGKKKPSNDGAGEIKTPELAE